MTVCQNYNAIFFSNHIELFQPNINNYFSLAGLLFCDYFEVEYKNSIGDGWMKNIKQKFCSGLFWAVRAAERKKNANCHKYATI